MDSIEAAIAEIESRKPGELFSYRNIAKKFGVDRITLARRHQGIQGTKADQYKSQRLLSNKQAKELIKYINKLLKRGLYLTHKMLRNFTQEICGTRPGYQWPSCFIRAYEKELTCRYTTGIDRDRKAADSAWKYTLYFQKLARMIEEYKIQPENMYNMDEKGFLIRIVSKSKRIFSKPKYKRDRSVQRIQDGNRDWITVIACICAD
ncbi:hypothetical protein EYZ11_013464 [Aspergillus tanneri]|uniref:HTH CENPB-type domain-containing protein n=1 Tax=Aspergillus tanneri TaxID=1220188 RepID=A0A4S3J310_9EURO|nr:hypothetical protein EYZ11_013464 [Aspergillus tanneri]